jgi:hypothetical protein
MCLRKGFKTSQVVAWYRLSATDVPLPMGSRTVPDHSYKLLTSDNCKSQLTQQQLQNQKLCYGRQAPIWCLRSEDIYYCLVVAGLLFWDAVSDETTGLPFT